MLIKGNGFKDGDDPKKKKKLSHSLVSHPKESVIQEYCCLKIYSSLSFGEKDIILFYYNGSYSEFAS